MYRGSSCPAGVRGVHMISSGIIAAGSGSSCAIHSRCTGAGRRDIDTQLRQGFIAEELHTVDAGLIGEIIVIR